jgi:hypothetical protein
MFFQICNLLLFIVKCSYRQKKRGGGEESRVFPGATRTRLGEVRSWVSQARTTSVLSKWPVGCAAIDPNLSPEKAAEPM